MSKYFRCRWWAGWLTILAGLFCLNGSACADLAETVQRIKTSILIVGTYKPMGSPQFALRGAAFVVGDGNLAVTNAHVLAAAGGAVSNETGGGLVVQVRRANGELNMRRAIAIAIDKTHDLALLRFDGPAVPALSIRDSSTVREGDAVAFIGFPIGGALGYAPVTHRGIISSITPIALPAPTANKLNEKVVQRIKDGIFNIYQLDATAYPGNSGGPVFDPETGQVIGVINMIFVKSTKEAALSQPSGITYAIPASFIAGLLR